MQKWLIWSGALVAAVVVAVVLRATVLAPDPVRVSVVPVERARVEATVTNTKAGTVRARRRAKLSAETGGRIVEIAHREGDEVESGALLIRLNDATHKAQIRLAREALRATQASRRQACIARDRARRELERNRTLAEKAIVSADVLDRLESVYETAHASCSAVGAEVDRAQAQIAAAEVELEKTAIRAPFKGVIAEVRVEVGEWVTPSPPLLTAPAVIDVIDPSSTYVSAPMDEVDSASIHAGQGAKVTVDSHPGVEFAGEVVRVAPYVLDVEAQNRTVEIEVEIEDRELAATLLPGTSADVEVVLQVRDGVLRVPTSALLEGNRVLVPDDGTLVEQAVQVGLKNWDYAEILEGLEAQDRVVISLDRAEVQAGARVEVEETEYRP
jgi:HlyD family secretion protein